MVLYRVHAEARLDKYYSTLCSKATLFQAVLYALMIIPPLFVALTTNEFWQSTSSYREQPRVTLQEDALVQLGGREVNGSGSGLRAWSTIASFLGQDSEELFDPDIMVSEEDLSNDTQTDSLDLRLEFTELDIEVHSVQMILFFQLEFSRFSSVIVQSLVYTSQSWPVAASGMSVLGELGLNQRLPLPSSGRVEQYSSAVINSSGLLTEDYGISDILREYNRRNLTTILQAPHIVWESGSTGNFTITVKLQYPDHTVTYYPNFWQRLKFAWVQYLAVFVVFWWVLSVVQSFVFQNKVILTVTQRKDKPHKH